MKKLLVVYNPRSSQCERIQKEVLDVARKQQGWMVGRFEVKPLSVAENVVKLARMLSDGDLVIVAGGDGTASMVANSIMYSGKDVVLGVLGYGNFNDMGQMLNGKSKVGFQEIVRAFEESKSVEMWPLEVKVDGVHWRYAMCYATLGMFAESTQIFDDKKVRERLQRKKHDLVFSIRQLAKWYFRHHKQEFLPAFTLNGEEQGSKSTDYIAVNSPTMAKVLKSEDWSLESKEFGRVVGELGSLWRLGRFMLKGMFSGMNLQVSEYDVLKFTEPASIEIHAEGEYERLEGVREVIVNKAEKPIRVIKLS